MSSFHQTIFKKKNREMEILYFLDGANKDLGEF